MKNSFVSSGQSFFLLFVFLLIAGIFILIYFNHVEKNKDYLIQRNFRQLNSISTKIQQRAIGLSDAIFNTTKGRGNIDSVKQKLYELINDARSITVNTSSKQEEELKFISRNDTLFLNIIKTANNFVVDLQVSGIGEFLEKKKEQGLFDDFFLASTSGDSVLQTSSSIITISKLEKVIPIDGKDSLFINLSNQDAVAKLNSGGEDYILFIHPLQIFSSTVEQELKWVLCGIIQSDKFHSETRAISTNVILLFIAIAVLIILAWPLLQLRFVNRYGHIKAIDVTMAALSINFAAAIITFTVIDLITYDKLNQDIDEQLESLSNNIRNNLLEEIKMVSNEISYITDNLKTKLDTINNENNLYLERGKYGKYINLESILTTNKDPYRFFDLMYWMDSSGKQKYKLPLRKKLTPFINVGEREYFRRVITKNLWRIKNDKDTHRIFLQPTISYTTGDYSLTLSKEAKLRDTDAVCVGAVDFLPISAYSTLLPYGFSFCIVNEKGDVIFHSNKDRDLNENCIKECDNPNLVSAVLKMRAKEKFTTNYWGRQNRVVVIPIEELPWYVMVMFDKDVLNSSNLETVSVAVFLYLLYILPIIIITLILLMIKGFTKNWLWPQVKELKTYRNLLYCYIIFTLVLLYFNFISDDQTVVFFLSGLLPHSAVVLTIVTVFVRLRMQTLTKIKVHMWVLPLIIVILDILFVLLILIFAENFLVLQLNFDKIWSLKLGGSLIVWVFVTLLGYLILMRDFFQDRINKPLEKIEDSVRKLIEKLFSRVKYIITGDFSKRKVSPFYKATTWYCWTLTFLLILGTIVPAIGFFKVTYKTQIKLYIKQVQLDFYKKWQERGEEIYKLYQTKNYYLSDSLKNKRLEDFSDIYISSFYNTNYNENRITDIKDTLSASTWFDVTLVHTLIPQYGRTKYMSEVLINDPDDSAYVWASNSDHLFFKFNKYPPNISTRIPQLNEAFSDGRFSIIFIFLLAAGIIFLFYYLMKSTTKWAFLIHALDMSPSMYDKLVNENLRNNILLLSDKLDIGDDLKNKVKGECIWTKELMNKKFDFKTKKMVPAINSDAIDQQTSLIIILKDFDFDFTDHEINDKKLRLLEDLIYSKKKAIIIISQIHPLGGFTLTEKDATAETKENITNRWRDILSSFTELSYYNQPKENQTRQPEENQTGQPNQVPNSFIVAELKNETIKRFHPKLLTIADDMEKLGKDFSQSELYDTAMEKTRSYHQFLWNSCSTDEKLVLYRLAENRFVSVSNISTVEVLFRRGLIKRDPNIKPLNTFFTNYILESSHPEEKNWRLREAQSGWGKFRIPIFLVLAGIVIFLFSTQSEIYTTTLTFIGAASALIPALLKLLGLFDVRQSVDKEED